jgi:hypothetical protein
MQLLTHNMQEGKPLQQWTLFMLWKGKEGLFMDLGDDVFLRFILFFVCFF